MSNAVKAFRKLLEPHLEIKGNSALSGHLPVSGAKNSALVLMTASLLTDQKLRLLNIPQLTDIDGMEEILRSLGEMGY